MARDRTQPARAEWYDRMKNNQSLHIFGQGDQTRDFVYVKDVANANLAALSCKANRTFNIGTQRSTSVDELVRVIEEVNQSVCNVEYFAPRAGDILHSVLDVQHSLNELGWSPVYNIGEGIKEMVL